jgi:hypothetical protein
MTGIEGIATTVGRTIVQRAAREWPAVRASRQDGDKDLAEPLRTGFPDRFVRRRLDRRLDTLLRGDAGSGKGRTKRLAHQRPGRPGRALPLRHGRTAASAGRADQEYFEPETCARRVLDETPWCGGRLILRTTRVSP